MGQPPCFVLLYLVVPLGILSGCNAGGMDPELIYTVTIPAALVMALVLLVFCIGWRITTERLPAEALPDVFQNADTAAQGAAPDSGGAAPRRFVATRRMGFNNIIARQKAEREEKARQLRSIRLAMEDAEGEPPKPFYPAP